MLDPFVANQADVSFEWYFRPEALVSVALYYKDVDSHIGYTTEPVTIDGITYAVTGPFNGEGGGITGAEFTFQTPFSGAFRDFGIYINYAYRRYRREGVLSRRPIHCPSKAMRSTPRRWTSGRAARAGKRAWVTSTTSPFSDHRGLEWLGRAHPRRRDDPRLQPSWQVNDVVRHALPGEQPDQRAAAHRRATTTRIAWARTMCTAVGRCSISRSSSELTEDLKSRTGRSHSPLFFVEFPCEPCESPQSPAC